MVYSYTIPEHLAGLRIDKALSVLSNLSRSAVQKSIHQALVIINDVCCRNQDSIAKTGDVVSFSIPEIPVFENITSPVILEPIYEDDDLVVINKPAGMTVHPGAGTHNNDTLVHALLARYQSQLSDIGGAIRPGIVHRLDRDTSGLLVVAKNNFTHTHLAQQIADRALKRKYLTITWGCPKIQSGTVINQVTRSRVDRTKMTIVKRGGKLAVTNYDVLAISPIANISLVKCSLETGRTHQIRLHMSSLACSIVGDQKYGKNKIKVSNLLLDELKEHLENFNRQALHSYYLSFTQPKTGKQIECFSPIPEDMHDILLLLKINLDQLNADACITKSKKLASNKV